VISPISPVLMVRVSRYQGPLLLVKTPIEGPASRKFGAPAAIPGRAEGVYHRRVERLTVDGFDRLYETARALGEETRFGIYRELCTSPEPISVSALATTFSLHPNAIRQHLARLEQAGLVVSKAERSGGGAGRPRRLYGPSPQPMDFAHPPRSIRSLVTMLAGALDTLPADEKALKTFGRTWGRSWASRRKRGNGSAPRSRRGRVQYLTGELRAWGWEPVSVRENGSVRIATGRCLFHDLIPHSGRCCALEHGLLGGLVESMVNGHARVERTEGCQLEVVL
jgi:predicted ArsR family transcriptional regulator